MRNCFAALLLIAIALPLGAGLASGTPLKRRNAASAEPLAGVETIFGELRAPDGHRLRTLLTRPEGARRRLPAIYFVQWLSCDTVEIGQTTDGWAQMMRILVQDSGMVVMRLDKAGAGDSEGVCSELDYETELAHHKLALQSLIQSPWIDRERIFVFGASMGANFAPLLANGEHVRGVAVWGGGAQSWFERQLGFERRALELSNTSGAEIDRRIRILSRVYSAVLLDGSRPADLASRDPDFAAAWQLATGAESDTQFGRSIVFHQQAQAQQWARAWETLNAPILVLYGENDWYDSVESVELIGSIVNRSTSGRAEVRILPGVDHHFTRYRSKQDAFTSTGGVPDAKAAMDILLPWLKRHAE